MPAPHLIGPPVGSTPAALKASWRGGRALPEDLLREASRRLGIMAMLAAVLWVVGTLLDHLVLALTSPEHGRWLRTDMSEAIAGVNVAVSLALVAYVRRRDRDPWHTLDLGRWYMIFTAFSLGIMWHWEPVPATWPVFPMFSWLGAIVLIFAAIVPSTPGKTLVAGLISVSMNPIGMLIARARGIWSFPHTSDVLLMHYPDFILVGVSVVIARVVAGLGQQVAKAREMGSYQLGELLGHGGMGEVYQATHRMLARPAAIKLIRQETLGGGNSKATELAVRRFHQEAKVAASLRSPHTVELYDFGETGDQTLYFVMELLDGMDLESLVRETGPVPAARVIHILRQVCESLEEAHARGLVHRDIKPANIHIGRLGLRHDFVKVLDFGLVKPMTGASSEHSLMTAAGTVPGTPAYMAPEVGMGEPFDGRADIYGLGCVAYYLLTGQLVFEASDWLRVIAKHLNEIPVPPSERTELPVPAALERLVLACLAKKPGDRPASAAELSRALGAIDQAPWGEEQAARWWQAHRPAAAP
jgi:serine/threonine-protein kinase